MNARQMAIDLLKAMQSDAVAYLVPDNDCGADWFVNRMLWHLDGPQQRAAQTALEAELAQVAEPVAAEVVVRRTNGPWQRYSVYGSIAAAEDIKSRTDGNGIEVRVVPLYTAPPEPVNAELLAELQNIANANLKNWDAPYNDTPTFQVWAQNRARAAIAKIGATT